MMSAIYDYCIYVFECTEANQREGSKSDFLWQEQKIMKVRKGTKKRTSKELAIAVIITMLLCVVMVWICYHAVEKMLWQERGTNLNNTMEKIAQCINLVMEEQWDNLDAYCNRLHNAQPETLERTFAVLSRAEQERNKDNIYLFALQ